MILVERRGKRKWDLVAAADRSQKEIGNSTLNSSSRYLLFAPSASSVCEESRGVENLVRSIAVVPRPIIVILLSGSERRNSENGL